jgi:hypothetical protein
MTYVPLASTADFNSFGSFPLLVRDYAAGAVDTLMLRASRAVETRCDRRLAPFTLTESHRAHGVDIDGGLSSNFPLNLAGALGRSAALSLGVTDMIRDVWLREHAPRNFEQWTYSNVSIVLARTYGDTENVAGSSLEGPEPDTGHLRFRLGTFVPSGTTVRVTYSGGYADVPEDLNMATVLTAAKLAIVSAEPQNRKDMSTEELDAEILGLLVGYIRG